MLWNCQAQSIDIQADAPGQAGPAGEPPVLRTVQTSQGAVGFHPEIDEWSWAATPPQTHSQITAGLLGAPRPRSTKLLPKATDRRVSSSERRYIEQGGTRCGQRSEYLIAPVIAMSDPEPLAHGLRRLPVARDSPDLGP